MMHPIVVGLGPNEDQIPAITQRGCDVVVTAGAGTGKTLTLVGRYLSLLAGGLQPRQIAAITFTRKSAREMRNRVRQTIDEYLRQPGKTPEDRQLWLSHYAALDAARIGTIHSLCTEILRAHPAEAGVDPRFALLEESDAALLKADAVDAALAWASLQAGSSTLFKLFGERGLRQVLDMLLRERPKTKAILNDLPQDVMGHWEECLRRRQRQTLEAALQRAEWADAVDSLQQNEPIDEDDRMAQQRRLALAAVANFRTAPDFDARRNALNSLGEINLTGGSQKNWPGGKEQLADVKRTLRALRGWWQAQSALQTLALNGSDKALAEALPALRDLFARADEVYAQSRRRSHALDFDDLEVMALRLLHENVDVCERWRGEIQAVLVDEYQDTNGRQRDLVNLLNDGAGKLFIVGDAKQSIYRFRGADISVFREERARIGQNGRAVQLSRSYRAHKALIGALNGLLSPVLGEESAVRHEWQEPFAPLHAVRGDPQPGAEFPYVELHLTAGSKGGGALDQAAQVLAARLSAIVAAPASTLRFGDVAILCRASTSFAAYENALDSASIPYVTVAGRGFFERPEVRDVLNALQAIADPRDDVALVGLLRSPVSGFTDGELLALMDRHHATENVALWQTLIMMTAQEGPPGHERIVDFVDLVKRLHGRVGRLSVADVLKGFIDQTGYRAALRLAGQPRAIRNIDKLLELAHSSGFVSSADFLEFVSMVRGGVAREGEARTSGENAVQIMSVHQAKGLQFPVVVIGDISYPPRGSSRHFLDEELGFVAAVQSEADEKPAVLELAKMRDESQSAAESARLLYVAATRVKEKLILNGNVRLNNRGQVSSPSGWLGALNAPLALSEAAVDFDEAGGRALPLSLSAVDNVACTVYEPQFSPAPAIAVEQEVQEQPGEALSAKLIGPLPVAAAPGEDPSAERVWRVIPSDGAYGIAPHLLGNLVHEALCAWRFPSGPDDEAFIRWVQARARQVGVIDRRRLEAVTALALGLLSRFKRHALFQKISSARRRFHEVPFTYLTPEDHEKGRIDLLFEDDDGWHLVDFKTDRIMGQAVLDEKMRDVYGPQLERYARSVRRLLGVNPHCMLCLLDFRGQSHVLHLASSAD